MNRNSNNRPQRPDFLAPTKKMPRAAVLIALLGPLLIGLYYWATHDYDWHFLLKWDEKRRALIFNFVTGTVASVVASFIFVWFYQKESSQMDRLRQLTDPDFLNKFFSDLKHFDARICHDYTVRITLSPIPERQDLLKVKVSYSYYKRLKDRHLRFKITRLRSDLDHKTQPDHDAAFFSHECYFNLNERDIVTPPADVLYSFENLLIQSTKLDFHKINSDAMFYECESEIPQGIPLDDVKISFDVAFPMERESFLAINAELPTQIFDVLLDYKDLDGNIQVVGQNFVSSLFGPNEIERSDSTHTIQFALDGWLMPKNGIVFCWWKLP